MGLSRYYLVRRESREFIGPMMIDEFKNRLERMDFGMQDEVASHCGPWLVLDHKEDVSKHYPEISTALGDSLPLSWREVTGHAQVISRKDSRRDKKKQPSTKKSHSQSRDGFNEFLRQKKIRSQRIKIGAFAVLATSAILAGIILSKKEDSPSITEMTALANKSDPSEFLTIMGLKVIPNVGRLVKSNKVQVAWAPLLRMYAFYTTGSIDGVSPKLIRGELSAAAPQDCSVESWKLRWRENAGQVVQFLQGRALSKNPWTKVLSIDPNWLRRRSFKGWLKPRSYYEGCIMTAATAMRSIAGDSSFGSEPQDGVTADVLTMVSRRLQQQLDMITTGRVITASDKNSVLGAMTCVESWGSIPDLDSCRSSITEGPLKPLMDEKYGMALVRVAVNQAQGAPDPKLTMAIQSYLPKMGAEDLMSRLDVTAEFKLLTYLSNGGSVDLSLTKVEQEYVDVRLR